MNKGLIYIIIISVVTMAYVMQATAVPQSPTIVDQSVNSSWADPSDEKILTAYGGNVSMLAVNNTRQTVRWQGYYGNITGKITLDNADQNTFYDWELAEISGEVYASNTSISGWDTIHCINFSAPGMNCSWQNSETSQNSDNTTCMNVSKMETAYGMDANDNDGVNETFSTTYASLEVGTVTVSDCPATNIYSNDTKDTNYWPEVLLTLNNSDTIIYASVIDDDQWGYDSKQWDFQLLVGDNGEDETPTTYYFYIEIA